VATVRVEVPGGARHGVTVSIGAVVSQGGDPDAHEFIRRADVALYRAKEAGRDRVCVWVDGARGEEPAASENAT